MSVFPRPRQVTDAERLEYVAMQLGVSRNNVAQMILCPLLTKATLDDADNVFGSGPMVPDDAPKQRREIIDQLALVAMEAAEAVIQVQLQRTSSFVLADGTLIECAALGLDQADGGDL